MPNLVKWSITLCAALFALGGLAAGEPDKVPADFSPQTDAAGLRWDIQQNGAINDGDSDCFDNGLRLTVNGQQFNSQQAMMTPDRTEYFLTGRRMPQNLEVVRRIRLDRQRGYMQYFEIVKNQSPQDIQVNCVLQSNLGSQPQGFFTEGGQAFAGGALGPKGVGVLALQGPGSRPSVLFLLADEKTKLKPSVMANGNNINVNYTFTLKPQEIGVIMHLVVQRRALAQGAIAGEFAALYNKRRLQKIPIPKDLLPGLLNFAQKKGADDSVESAAGSAFQLVRNQLEELGLEAADKDRLIFDEASSLAGDIAIPAYRVITAYGAIDVPARDIAVIRGGSGSGRTILTTLRTGEVLAGAVEAKGMKMTTGKGMAVNLDPTKFNLVVMRKGMDDGYAAPGTAVLVCLHTGDILALHDKQQVPLQGATPWGSLKLDLTELKGVSLVRNPHPIYQLTLADGGVYPVILYGDPLSAKTLRFGEQKIQPLSVVGLYPAIIKVSARSEDEDSPEAEEAEFELDRYAPCFQLGEGIRAAGSFGIRTLSLVNEGGVTTVPVAQIRRMLRQESEDEQQLRYSVKLMDGSTLIGTVGMQMIQIVTARGALQVPMQHITEYCGKNPKPKSKPKPKEVVKPKVQEKPVAKSQPKDTAKDKTAGQVDTKAVAPALKTAKEKTPEEAKPAPVPAKATSAAKPVAAPAAGIPAKKVEAGNVPAAATKTAPTTPTPAAPATTTGTPGQGTVPTAAP